MGMLMMDKKKRKMIRPNIMNKIHNTSEAKIKVIYK